MKWQQQRFDPCDMIFLPGSTDRPATVETAAARGGFRGPTVHLEGPAWYQREIAVPGPWRGKRMELFLEERPHWQTKVSMDGKGRQAAASPHHMCTSWGLASPDEHRITICVDNTYKIDVGATRTA